MIRVKSGVQIGQPVSAIQLAIQIVYSVWPSQPDLWITSLTDGDHKGKPVDSSGKDPHYVGKAIDFRIQEIPTFERAALVKRIQDALGDAYVVLWEGQGTGNEHLHVQYGKAVS